MGLACKFATFSLPLQSYPYPYALHHRPRSHPRLHPSSRHGTRAVSSLARLDTANEQNRAASPNGPYRV